MARSRFYVRDNFGVTKRELLTLAKNDITILVGKNGYGKSSLLLGLKTMAENNGGTLCVYWSDKEYGRSNGMSILEFQEDYEGLSSMAFRSEGQTMMSSIGIFFARKCGSAMRKLKPDTKRIFLLIDQLDSGLDVHQIMYIKDVLRDTIIPDMNKRGGLDVYVVMTANSFEMVVGEDCLDPNTRKHMTFSTLEQYKEYIDAQYAEEDEDPETRGGR